MKAERLIELYDRISEAPDAVSRLRRFVLDLAVRGKLVEQDPEDEPASALLARISAEKEQLLANGKRRKASDNEPADESKQSFALPPGWICSRIEDLGVIGPRNDAPDDAIASFVPMPKIASEYGYPHQHEPRTWGEIKKGYTHFAEGDVGLAKITPCFENGKSTVFRNLTGGIGAGTTELHVLRPILVDPDYVLLFLKSPDFIETGIPNMTGTAGQKRVPREYFANTPFPLPPLAEQHRIVAKVDELMALCDRLEERHRTREASRDRLTTATLSRLTAADTDEQNFRDHARFALDTLPALTARPDQIKTLRQTILDLAVRGKLVEQDAAENIAARFSERADFYWLPATWRTLNFGKHCDIEGGNQPPKSQFVYEPRQGYVRFLQIRDLGEKPAPVYIPADSTNRFCREGEILIGRYGASVGKIFWAQNGAYNVALTKFVWPEDAFTAEFAFILLKSYLFQEKISGASRSAQAGFNKRDLRDIDFPLPPISEQDRIVAKVNELMALCVQLEGNLAKAETMRSQLLESMLQEALQLTPAKTEHGRCPSTAVADSSAPNLRQQAR